MCIHAKAHSYNEIMQQQKNQHLLIGFFHQNANGIIFGILSLFAHWMLPFELVNTDCKVKWVILKTMIEKK